MHLVQSMTKSQLTARKNLLQVEIETFYAERYSLACLLGLDPDVYENILYHPQQDSQEFKTYCQLGDVITRNQFCLNIVERELERFSDNV